MKENTNKSITMLIAETREKIAQVCNSSALPPCVLELIVINIYNEINQLTVKQLNEDRLTYMNTIISKDETKSEGSKE